jgi:hypothetical protein
MSATNLVRLGFLSVLLGGAAVLVAASPAAAPTLADNTSSNSAVSASHVPTVPTSSSPARLAAANTNGSSLAGTLKLQAGSCAGGETGSYFRMILPGKTANGPDSSYISNGNSTCSDETYTLLGPGTDGGLVIGGYQPGPSPAFDGSGNSLASQITEPVAFFGIKFSVDTSAVDAQTGQSVPVPSLNVDGSGDLSGNLEAVSAAWNNQYFNQGSPKPGGATPGLTAGPTGTYNSSTGAITLDWTSQIVGGPFNSFTGQWHFTGTFTLNPGSAPTTVAPTTVTPTTATTAPKSSGSPTTTSARSASSSVSTPTNSISTSESSSGSDSVPAIGSASPQDSPAGSSTNEETASTESSTPATLADTGLSIPPFIGVPPLLFGLALLVVARRMSRRTRPMTP